MSILDHLAAIQRDLATDEIGALRRYVMALSPVERDKFIATLQSLSVEDALAIIRSELDLAAEREAAASRPPATQPIPAVDAFSVSHLLAIEAALAPDERKAASATYAGWSTEEQVAWSAKLQALSVDDATALVRDLVAKNSAHPPRVER